MVDVHAQSCPFAHSEVGLRLNYFDIQTLQQVARSGSQIAHSHQMISDEMAHFQRLRSAQMIKLMNTMARTQLERERSKLVWLKQAWKECC